MSWAGFVNFKKQNRELLFASSVGQAGRVKIKLGDGLIPISGRKSNVMMKCFKLTTRWFATAMKPNGPAVVVVSITGGCGSKHYPTPHPGRVPVL